MFTGIITDVGSVVGRDADGRFALQTNYDLTTVALGASIACNGVCLTVIERTPVAAKLGSDACGRFVVQVSAETLARTTLDDWREGTPVNLERALRLGDELGGHLASGHVDGVARVLERRQDGVSVRFVFEAPEELAYFIAPKGSVALDGVSLTVNEVDKNQFGVNIIPHTLSNTNFGGIQSGSRVNLEIDLLARYVARLAERP
ncbi:Riboflavin synthase [Azospirillaceae bacterium]